MKRSSYGRAAGHCVFITLSGLQDTREITNQSSFITQQCCFVCLFVGQSAGGLGLNPGHSFELPESSCTSLRRNLAPHRVFNSLFGSSG